MLAARVPPQVHLTGPFLAALITGGIITGNYIGSKNLIHGFLRSPEGEFTTFDAPGASTAAGGGNGTLPKSITAEWAITGHYADAKV